MKKVLCLSSFAVFVGISLNGMEVNFAKPAGSQENIADQERIVKITMDRIIREIKPERPLTEAKPFLYALTIISLPLDAQTEPSNYVRDKITELCKDTSEFHHLKEKMPQLYEKCVAESLFTAVMNLAHDQTFYEKVAAQIRIRTGKVNVVNNTSLPLNYLSISNVSGYDPVTDRTFIGALVPNKGLMDTGTRLTLGWSAINYGPMGHAYGLCIVLILKNSAGASFSFILKDLTAYEIKLDSNGALQVTPIESSNSECNIYCS